MRIPILVLSLLALAHLAPPALAGDDADCSNRQQVARHQEGDVAVTVYLCSRDYVWEVDPPAVQQGPLDVDPAPVGHADTAITGYVLVEYDDGWQRTPLLYYTTTCWIGLVASLVGLGYCG